MRARSCCSCGHHDHARLRRPCSMVSAPLPGAEVRALGTRGTPGRAAGPRAQARPGTARPCTLDLPRALALPKAAGSRTGVPWPEATTTWGGCAWQAASSRPRRPLSIAGPSAAASARFSVAARSGVSGSRGLGQPSPAALPWVSPAPSPRCRYSRRRRITTHERRGSASIWAPAAPESLEK